MQTPLACLSAILLAVLLQQSYAFTIQYGREIPSRKIRNEDNKWKTGPSPNSWYYMMGHPSNKRSMESSFFQPSFSSNSAALLRQLRSTNDDVMGISLMSDFMAYLSLKESGVLDACLGMPSGRKTINETEDKKKRR